MIGGKCVFTNAHLLILTVPCDLCAQEGTPGGILVSLLESWRVREGDKGVAGRKRREKSFPDKGSLYQKAHQELEMEARELLVGADEKSFYLPRGHCPPGKSMTFY